MGGEQTELSTTLRLLKVWERYADDVRSIFKRTHLENYFRHI